MLFGVFSYACCNIIISRLDNSSNNAHCIIHKEKEIKKRETTNYNYLIFFFPQQLLSFLIMICFAFVYWDISGETGSTERIVLEKVTPLHNPLCYVHADWPNQRKKWTRIMTNTLFSRCFLLFPDQFLLGKWKRKQRFLVKAGKQKALLSSLFL